MGTRAIITKDGQPLIATHWDGYPESLGKDLSNMIDLSTESLIKVAEGHSIDFIEKTIGEQVKENRIQELSKRHKLPIEEIKKGMRRGSVLSSDDWEIGDIAIYDDWAEYQYDIRDNSIYWRELSGSWKNSKKTKNGWNLLRKY